MINEIKRSYKEIISDSSIGNRFRYYCNCCNHRVRKFLLWGAESDIYARCHIIGGGVRATRCPICDSIDRYRWFLYVIQNYTSIFQTKCTVLHFAPEKEISSVIRRCKHITYFTADKDRNSADCEIDMTDIPFQAERFDYIIANHVLSYIKDEEKAIYEMKRCLKPGGEIILSFPICTDVDTYENFEAKDKGIDLAIFGTKENVRMYGKDYKQRLERYGLKVTEYIPEYILDKEIIENLCLIKDDVVLICENI